MIETKSVIKLEKNNKVYTFTCDTDSPLYDVKAILDDMSIYVSGVIAQVEKKIKEAEQPQEENVPDTEQTL